MLSKPASESTATYKDAPIEGDAEVTFEKIEFKFLVSVDKLPADLSNYPRKEICQCT